MVNFKKQLVKLLAVAFVGTMPILGASNIACAAGPNEQNDRLSELEQRRDELTQRVAGLRMRRDELRRLVDEKMQREAELEQKLAYLKSI